MNASETAARLLAAGRKTKAALRRKLLDKGFAAEEVEEVLIRFSADGYIDDEAYATDFFRMAKRKGWGRRKAFFVLKQRGVESDVIRDAFAAYTQNAPYEEDILCFNLLRRLCREKDFDDKGAWLPARKAAMIRRLSSRGFLPATIYSAMEKLERERRA